MASRIWLVSVLLGISYSANAASLSGTYVGTGTDIAVLLQLVEANGGQLSGRYEQRKMINGNRLEQLNASVTGTSDGQTIVLQVRPTEVLAGTYVLSGTVSGSIVRLNGGGYGQTFQLNLTKGSEEDFKGQVANLSASVNRTVATANLETELTKSEKILEAMSNFSKNPKPEPSAFVPYEQRYRSMTIQMQAALGRQQSIPKFIETPARGQIDTAINQASIETDQIHEGMKSKDEEFQKRTIAALQTVEPLVDRCKDISAQANIAPPTLEKLKSQCGRFKPIAKKFIEDAKKIADSYAKIEAVWREERQKQDAIVRSADIAAR